MAYLWEAEHVDPLKFDLPQTRASVRRAPGFILGLALGLHAAQ